MSYLIPFDYLYFHVPQPANMDDAQPEEVDKIADKGFDDIWDPSRTIARKNIKVLRKEQISQGVLSALLRSLGRLSFDQVKTRNTCTYARVNKQLIWLCLTGPDRRHRPLLRDGLHRCGCLAIWVLLHRHGQRQRGVGMFLIFLMIFYTCNGLSHIV